MSEIDIEKQQYARHLEISWNNLYDWILHAISRQSKWTIQSNYSEYMVALDGKWAIILNELSFWFFLYILNFQSFSSPWGCMKNDIDIHTPQLKFRASSFWMQSSILYDQMTWKGYLSICDVCSALIKIVDTNSFIKQRARVWKGYYINAIGQFLPLKY